MNRDARALSALLTCLGIVLLLPPIALIFDKPFSAAGVPVAALYVFGIWIVLIVFAIFVSRSLPRGD